MWQTFITCNEISRYNILPTQLSADTETISVLSISEYKQKTSLLILLICYKFCGRI